jgi:hypothetical protein
MKIEIGIINEKQRVRFRETVELLTFTHNLMQGKDNITITHNLRREVKLHLKTYTVT